VPPAAARDPFGRAAAPQPAQPPPYQAQPAPYVAQPVGAAYSEAEASGGGRAGLLVIVGIIAGAGVGAAIALGAMVLLDVSPF
jgi:hypothetical protein